MTLVVTHSFVSTIPEDPASGIPGGLAGPGEWNAPHAVTGTVTPANIAGVARQILTANQTYFVSTAGSDTTGDGSNAKPWATGQHAWNYIGANIDPGGNAVYRASLRDSRTGIAVCR